MRAILHIGGEKTGSTSIQWLLEANRAALAAAGFGVPRGLGGSNHVALAAYAGREMMVRDLLGMLDEPQGLAGLRAWLPARLAMLLGGQPAGIHTMLFSNEHCQSRLHTPEEVARLRDLLAPHFSQVVVLVYLRRQDQVVISSRNTSLRSHGRLPAAWFPTEPGQLALLDHALLLLRWGQVFGAAALRPRLYQADEATHLQDFLDAIGAPPLPLNPPRRLNRSLGPAAEAWLVGQGAGGAWPLPGMAALLKVLETEYPGPGARPARAEAARFLARFAASNQVVRDTWFADRPSLFDTDLSDYPEQATPPPSAAEIAALAERMALVAQG